MFVTLTPAEMSDATDIGERRNRVAVAAGIQSKYGAGRDDARLHILGAMGECAFCKQLNIPWPRYINTYKHKPNVGEYDVQCRSEAHYELMVRPDNNMDWKYVLVLGPRPPLFEIVGWKWGRDAQRDDWLKSYGGRPAAWFVPQGSLNKFAGEPNRFDDFIFDEPEPPIPSPLPDNNEYLKEFLAWSQRRRDAKRRHRQQRAK